MTQAYRGIDWSTCILIGAMIPMATAMTATGTSTLIGDYIVGALGEGGNIAVLVGVFAATALVSQFISNTSSALVMMPIGMATAQQLGVSPLPLMMGAGLGFEALGKVGLKTSMNRARVLKLVNSTNVVPRVLPDLGYGYETDLRESLKRWKAESPSGEFV